MKIKNMSSKKLILLIILMLAIPLLLFLVGYTIYMGKFLDRNIAQINQAKVESYEKSIQENLQQIEFFLSDLVANNSNVAALRYTETKLEAHENTYVLEEKYKNELMNYNILTGLYLCSVRNNIYRGYYQKDVSLEEQLKLNEYVKKLTQEEIFINGWYVENIEEHYYLVRVFRMYDTLVAAVVDFDTISEVINYTQTDSVNCEASYLIFVRDGIPLSFGESLQKKGIKINELVEDYNITGEKTRYIAVYNKMEYLNLSIAYFLPYYGRRFFDPNIMILIMAIFMLLCLVGISYWILYRNYFIPMEEIIDGVNRVKAGEIHEQMEINSKIQEFTEVSNAFNSMMEQIINLKIEAYEQKVVIQDTELAYYQIQIRPHFYLNCLKNIYAMAQSGMYEKMQKMILYLSEYLRAMLKNETMITIKQELNNIINYIELQKMSQTYPPEIQIEIEDGLEELKIPSISILTFVENAIKHGTVMEHPLKIKIKIHTIYDERTKYLNIVVRDNGKGFSEDILKQLNEERKSLTAGIGIQNVLQRFKLCYGEQQIITFYNMQGACVDIYLQRKDEN